MPADARPKDRRLPLSVVVFKEPVHIPGAANMMTNVTAGEGRLMAGTTFTCPQPFFDPVHRTIWIEGREYPIERVVYWERAKMVRNIKPAVLPDYSIGKRAK